MEPAGEAEAGSAPKELHVRADLWAWCVAQDADTLLGVLAYCASHTVNAVLVKGDRPGSERFAHADALAEALGIDMAVWFSPTAENYFARISKTAILDALKEVKGATAPAWVAEN